MSLARTISIALVGDRRAEVTAHPAIERSLDALGARYTWFPTATITDAETQFADSLGIWCVPGSPYESLDGTLAAIRFAREGGVPFLGTCGGFQHLLLECARNLCQASIATHAEIDADSGDSAVCVPLECALREALGSVVFTPGSRLQQLLGDRCDDVGYNCGYSLAPAWQPRLESVGLSFTGHDAVSHAVRAVELSSHPFCIGTLFQPERSVLNGKVHPLIAAFVDATHR